MVLAVLEPMPARTFPRTTCSSHILNNIWYQFYRNNQAYGDYAFASQALGNPSENLPAGTTTMYVGNQESASTPIDFILSIYSKDAALTSVTFN